MKLWFPPNCWSLVLASQDAVASSGSSAAHLKLGWLSSRASLHIYPRWLCLGLIPCSVGAFPGCVSRCAPPAPTSWMSLAGLAAPLPASAAGLAAGPLVRCLREQLWHGSVAQFLLQEHDEASVWFSAPVLSFFLISPLLASREAPYLCCAWTRLGLPVQALVSRSFGLLFFFLIHTQPRLRRG